MVLFFEDDHSEDFIEDFILTIHDVVKNELFWSVNFCKVLVSRNFFVNKFPEVLRLEAAFRFQDSLHVRF